MLLTSIPSIHQVTLLYLCIYECLKYILPTQKPFPAHNFILISKHTCYILTRPSYIVFAFSCSIRITLEYFYLTHRILEHIHPNSGSALYSKLFSKATLPRFPDPFYFLYYSTDTIYTTPRSLSTQLIFILMKASLSYLLFRKTPVTLSPFAIQLHISFLHFSVSP